MNLYSQSLVHPCSCLNVRAEQSRGGGHLKQFGSNPSLWLGSAMAALRATFSFAWGLGINLFFPIIIAGCFFFSAVVFGQNKAEAAANCTGRFVNPISDICWDCAFPLTIGSAKLISGAGGAVQDTSNPSSPICICPIPVPPYQRIGLTVGFWEPARLMDLSRKPGCFSNLGGLDIPLGNVAFGATGYGDSGASVTNLHAHYYQYPVWSLLEALIDTVCLDPGSGFDIAWVSELDPLWLNDELTFLIQPESALFTSLPAHAACAADCVFSTLGLPLTELFWCAGCQGSMYPMTGNVTAHVGGVQAALLTAERLLYRLHRQLVAWGTIGNGALCMRYPMPIMNKRQYRLQLTQPIAMTTPALACNPPGRTSTHYEWRGGEFPVAGENWGFLVWRKRNCCLL